MADKMTDKMTDKPARSLSGLLDIYLQIIPQDDTTREYINQLKDIHFDLKNKDTTYWSPELTSEFFSHYWKITNGVLSTYNQKFIESSWARAILYICTYEYDKEEVKPYIHLLK